MVIIGAGLLVNLGLKKFVDTIAAHTNEYVLQFVNMVGFFCFFVFFLSFHSQFERCLPFAKYSSIKHWQTDTQTNVTKRQSLHLLKVVVVDVCPSRPV